MIAFIEGRLLFKSPEWIIVSAQGIGYQIAVPLSSFYDLPEIEQAVRLHIYTHVRQDAIQLFGFLTPREKEIFLLLLGVSGIGPKAALNILSGISSEDLSAALMAQDSARVQRIPGIGKKTSERIVLELKDKIRKLSPGAEVTLSQRAEEGPWQDALSALTNLGYPKAVAEKALSRIPREDGEIVSLEDILRKVLKLLSR
jgi:holliday junction DNA helicase RuvA